MPNILPPSSNPIGEVPLNNDKGAKEAANPASGNIQPAPVQPKVICTSQNSENPAEKLQNREIAVATDNIPYISQPQQQFSDLANQQSQIYSGMMLMQPVLAGASGLDQVNGLFYQQPNGQPLAIEAGGNNLSSNLLQQYNDLGTAIIQNQLQIMSALNQQMALLQMQMQNMTQQLASLAVQAQVQPVQFVNLLPQPIIQPQAIDLNALLVLPQQPQAVQVQSSVALMGGFPSAQGHWVIGSGGIPPIPQNPGFYFQPQPPAPNMVFQNHLDPYKAWGDFVNNGLKFTGNDFYNYILRPEEMDGALILSNAYPKGQVALSKESDAKINALRAQLKSVEGKVKELNQRDQENNKKVSMLQAEIDNLKSKLKNTNLKLEDSRLTINDLLDAVQKLNKEKVQLLADKRDMKNEIDQLRRVVGNAGDLLERSLADKESIKKEFDDRLDGVVRNMNGVQETNDRLEEQVMVLKEANKKLIEERDGALEKVNHLNGRFISLSEDLDQVKQQVADGDNVIAELKGKIKELTISPDNIKIQGLEEQIRSHQQKIGDNETKIRKIEKEKENLESEVERLTIQKGVNDASVEELKENLKNIQTEMVALKQKNDLDKKTIEENLKNAEDHLAKVKNENETLKNNLQGRERESEESNKELIMLKAELESNKEVVETLKRSFDEGQSSDDELKQKTDEAETKIKDLTKQLTDISVLKQKIVQMEDENNRTSKEIGRMKAELGVKVEEINGLNDEIIELNGLSTEANELNEQVKKLNDELEIKEGLIKQYQKDLDEKQGELKAKEAEIVVMETASTESSEILKKNVTEIQSLEQKLEGAENKLLREEKVNSNLEKKVKDLELELKKLTTENLDIEEQKVVNSIRDDVLQAIKDPDKLGGISRHIEEMLTDVASGDNLKSALAKLKGVILSLVDKNKELEQYDGDKKQAKSAGEHFEIQIKNQRDEIEKLEKQMATVTEELNSANQSVQAKQEQIKNIENEAAELAKKLEVLTESGLSVEGQKIVNEIMHKVTNAKGDSKKLEVISEKIEQEINEIDTIDTIDRIECSEEPQRYGERLNLKTELKVIGSYVKSLIDLEVRFKAATAEILTATQNARNEKLKADALKLDLATQKKELDKLTAKVKENKLELDKFEQTNRNLTDELEGYIREGFSSDAKSKIISYENQIMECSKDNAKLDAVREDLNEYLFSSQTRLSEDEKSLFRKMQGYIDSFKKENDKLIEVEMRKYLLTNEANKKTQEFKGEVSKLNNAAEEQNKRIKVLDENVEKTKKMLEVFKVDLDDKKNELVISTAANESLKNAIRVVSQADVNEKQLRIAAKNIRDSLKEECYSGTKEYSNKIEEIANDLKKLADNINEVEKNKNKILAFQQKIKKHDQQEQSQQNEIEELKRTNESLIKANRLSRELDPNKLKFDTETLDTLIYSLNNEHIQESLMPDETQVYKKVKEASVKALNTARLNIASFEKELADVKPNLQVKNLDEKLLWDFSEYTQRLVLRDSLIDKMTKVKDDFSSNIKKCDKKNTFEDSHTASKIVRDETDGMLERLLEENNKVSKELKDAMNIIMEKIDEDSVGDAEVVSKKFSEFNGPKDLEKIVTEILEVNLTSILDNKSEVGTNKTGDAFIRYARAVEVARSALKAIVEKYTPAVFDNITDFEDIDDEREKINKFKSAISRFNPKNSALFTKKMSENYCTVLTNLTEKAVSELAKKAPSLETNKDSKPMTLFNAARTKMNEVSDDMLQDAREFLSDEGVLNDCAWMMNRLWKRKIKESTNNEEKYQKISNVMLTNICARHGKVEKPVIAALMIILAEKAIDITSPLIDVISARYKHGLRPAMVEGDDVRSLTSRTSRARKFFLRCEELIDKEKSNGSAKQNDASIYRGTSYDGKGKRKGKVNNKHERELFKTDMPYYNGIKWSNKDSNAPLHKGHIETGNGFIQTFLNQSTDKPCEKMVATGEIYIKDRSGNPQLTFTQKEKNDGKMSKLSVTLRGSERLCDQKLYLTYPSYESPFSVVENDEVTIRDSIPLSDTSSDEVGELVKFHDKNYYFKVVEDTKLSTPLLVCEPIGFDDTPYTEVFEGALIALYACRNGNANQIDLLMNQAYDAYRNKENTEYFEEFKQAAEEFVKELPFQKRGWGDEEKGSATVISSIKNFSQNKVHSIPEITVNPHSDHKVEKQGYLTTLKKRKAKSKSDRKIDVVDKKHVTTARLPLDFHVQQDNYFEAMELFVQNKDLVKQCKEANRDDARDFVRDVFEPLQKFNDSYIEPSKPDSFLTKVQDAYEKQIQFLNESHMQHIEDCEDFIEKAFANLPGQIKVRNVDVAKKYLGQSLGTNEFRSYMMLYLNAETGRNQTSILINDLKELKKAVDVLESNRPWMTAEDFAVDAEKLNFSMYQLANRKNNLEDRLASIENEDVSNENIAMRLYESNNKTTLRSHQKKPSKSITSLVDKMNAQGPVTKPVKVLCQWGTGFGKTETSKIYCNQACRTNIGAVYIAPEENVNNFDIEMSKFCVSQGTKYNRISIKALSRNHSYWYTDTEVLSDIRKKVFGNGKNIVNGEYKQAAGMSTSDLKALLALHKHYAVMEKFKSHYLILEDIISALTGTNEQNNPLIVRDEWDALEDGKGISDAIKEWLPKDIGASDFQKYLLSFDSAGNRAIYMSASTNTTYGAIQMIGATDIETLRNGSDEGSLQFSKHNNTCEQRGERYLLDSNWTLQKGQKSLEATVRYALSFYEADRDLVFCMPEFNGTSSELCQQGVKLVNKFNSTGREVKGHLFFDNGRYYCYTPGHSRYGDATKIPMGSPLEPADQAEIIATGGKGYITWMTESRGYTAAQKNDTAFVFNNLFNLNSATIQQTIGRDRNNNPYRTFDGTIALIRNDLENWEPADCFEDHKINAIEAWSQMDTASDSIPTTVDNKRFINKLKNQKILVSFNSSSDSQKDLEGMFINALNISAEAWKKDKAFIDAVSSDTRESVISALMNFKLKEWKAGQACKKAFMAARVMNDFSPRQEALEDKIHESKKLAEVEKLAREDKDFVKRDIEDWVDSAVSEINKFEVKQNNVIEKKMSSIKSTVENANDHYKDFVIKYRKDVLKTAVSTPNVYDMRQKTSERNNLQASGPHLKKKLVKTVLSVNPILPEKVENITDGYKNISGKSIAQIEKGLENMELGLPDMGIDDKKKCEKSITNFLDLGSKIIKAKVGNVNDIITEMTTTSKTAAVDSITPGFPIGVVKEHEGIKKLEAAIKKLNEYETTSIKDGKFVNFRAVLGDFIEDVLDAIETIPMANMDLDVRRICTDTSGTRLMDKIGQLLSLWPFKPQNVTTVNNVKVYEETSVRGLVPLKQRPDNPDHSGGAHNLFKNPQHSGENKFLVKSERDGRLKSAVQSKIRFMYGIPKRSLVSATKDIAKHAVSANIEDDFSIQQNEKCLAFVDEVKIINDLYRKEQESMKTDLKDKITKYKKERCGKLTMKAGELDKQDQLQQQFMIEPPASDE